MRKMGIIWKILTKRTVAMIACLMAILLCFSTLFSLSACGGEDEYDLQVGGNYRTVAVWNTGVVDRYNVTTDHYGHKTFGMVPGETWGAYVRAGDGYFTYKFSAEAGKQFESLKIDLEAYYSNKYKYSSIYSYDVEDENGDWQTNIVVECSYDGKNFWSIYDFHEKHAEEFTNNENEYVGDNALEIDLTEYYSYKVGVLYVRLRIVHMTYNDFSNSEKSQYASVFGQTVGGEGMGINLFRLGVRIYSLFIRGNYVKTDK